MIRRAPRPPARRALDELRSELLDLAGRADELRAICAGAERAIRRGRRPAAALADLRTARTWLRAVLVRLGSARVELAHAELWAVYRRPVQLDLWEVA